MLKLIRRRLGILLILLVAVMAAGAVPASADPPIGVIPRPIDTVGVTDNVTQDLCDALSVSYNGTIPGHLPHLYCFDAVPHGGFTPKNGCVRNRPRPLTHMAEIADLYIHPRVAGHPCVDFAMISTGRQPGDPRFAPAGVTFVELARDAMTWAVRSAKDGGSDAPASLTPAQLKGIFTCTTTNWSAVGGKPGPIKAYLPQANSADLLTWEHLMGINPITGPGSCVSLAPAPDEGTYPGFNSPTAIFIYSVGAYIAQKYHSPNCGGLPAAGQNQFGCNQTGVLSLEDIDGIAPLTNAMVPVINPVFPAAFWRNLYEVVLYSTTTATTIPAYLEPIFDAATARIPGYVCASPAAKADVVAYGFTNTPLCGTAS